ncbi:MAG: hypothetical protein N3G20_03105 [Verrucomicrobiae bacterium]|nr:hypothetical protein [Verrucomicrobiae bacterium]
MTVSCAGLFTNWPVQVWTDDPGLKFTPGQTNGVFDLHVAPETRPGPHLIRFYDKEAVSTPIQFVLGELPEITTAVPQSEDSIQPIDSFPVVLNGLFIGTNCTHTYMIRLPENCQLEAAMCALALDSPVRPSVELLDGNTNRLAFVEPSGDRDVVLSRFLSAGGVYFLRVHGVSEGKNEGLQTRGEAGVYRLTVSAKKTTPSTTTAVEVTRAVETVVEMFRPMVAARTLMIPSVTRGVIAPAGRQINYGFESRGVERFRFQVRAESIGSPLRPRLRILDSEMNVLAESMPGGDTDLVWVSPAAGGYIAAITDADGNGGPLFSFQLEVQNPEPYFRASVQEHSYHTSPGDTVKIVVSLSRPSNSAGVLQLAPVGLPNGCSCTPQTAEPSTQEVTLELKVKHDAPPSSQPFVLSVVDVTSVPPRVGYAVAPVIGRHAPRGKLLVNETDQLWLTVGSGKQADSGHNPARD